MFIIRGEGFQIVIPKTEPFSITEESHCVSLSQILEANGVDAASAVVFYNDITIRTSATKYVLMHCVLTLGDRIREFVQESKGQETEVFEINECDIVECFRLENCLRIEKA